MNLICYNLISYILEYIKILLLSIIFFNIKVLNIKKTFILFSCSALCILFLSITYNLSEFGIFFGIISIIVIFLTLGEKNYIIYMLFIYTIICIFDMVAAAIVMFIFHLTIQILTEQYWIQAAINSISFFIILAINFLKNKYNKNILISILPKKYIFIFIIGTFSLGMYITAIQFIGFSDRQISYNTLSALCLSISSLIFIIICLLLLFFFNQNEHLKEEKEINRQLLEVQKNYFISLLEKEEETKQFRHDFKNHIFSMYTLFKNKQYTELNDYFIKMDKTLHNLKYKIYSDNKLVDALINDINKKHETIKIIWNGKMPNNISISVMDLCTIFSNLITNACESAEQTDNKVVEIMIKILNSNLLLTISNHSNQEPKLIEGSWLSTKKEKGHGYGMKNVKRCIELNNGILKTVYKNNIYCVNILFMNVITSK